MDLAEELAKFRGELERLNAAIRRLERLQPAKSWGGKSSGERPKKVSRSRTARGGRSAARPPL
jgi:hypothetical protein